MRRFVNRLAPWLYYVLPIAAALHRFDRLWKPGEFGRLDFRIYYEAVDTHHPGSLYDFRYPIDNLPFTYPPFAALLLEPVTLIGLITAERIWFVSSLVLFVWFADRCARLLPHDNLALKSVACAFIVITMPVTLSLQFGQINAVIAALLAIDMMLVDRKHRLGGLGLGLAAAIKVTPAYLGAVFAGARRVRHALVAGVTAVGATLVACVILPRDSFDYWTSALYDTERVGDIDEKFNSSLRRIVSWLGWSDSLSTMVWLVVAVVVTAIVIVRVRNSFAVGNVLAAYTIASIGGYLVSPVTWGHHLLFLGPAVALLVGDGRSIVRWAAALSFVRVIVDRSEGGEGARNSGWRILFMVLVVVLLPVDERRTDGQVAGERPTPRRWRTAAERYSTIARRSSAR
jgi:alpha-1,2-mannosyltransferase